MNSKALFSLFSHSLTLTIHYYFFPFTVFCWYCCCCWYCYCCLSRCAEDPLISGQTNKQTRGKLNSRSNSSTTTTTRAARLTSSHTFPPALSLSLSSAFSTSLHFSSFPLCCCCCCPRRRHNGGGGGGTINCTSYYYDHSIVCLSVCLSPSLFHSLPLTLPPFSTLHFYS